MKQTIQMFISLFDKKIVKRPTDSIGRLLKKLKSEIAIKDNININAVMPDTSISQTNF